MKTNKLDFYQFSLSMPIGLSNEIIMKRYISYLNKQTHFKNSKL